MQIRYIGPHDEVEIPALEIIAKHGEVIDVEEGAGQALTAQADWSVVDTNAPVEAIPAAEVSAPESAPEA